MIAKNREQYVETWRAHVGEIVHVALDANYEHPHWNNIKDGLEEMIERAATNTFGPKEAAA